MVRYQNDRKVIYLYVNASDAATAERTLRANEFDGMILLSGWEVNKSLLDRLAIR